MKKSIILFIFILISNLGLTMNDKDSIYASLLKFGEIYLMEESTFPEDYFFNFEEFKKLSILYNHNLTEEKNTMFRSQALQYLNNAYKRTKNELPKKIHIIQIDTSFIIRDNQKCVKAYYIFSDTSGNKTIMPIVFNYFYSHLIIPQTTYFGSRMNESGYKSTKMYFEKEKYTSQFEQNNYLIKTSLSHFIPYKLNDKYGIYSLEKKKKITEAKYDSIYFLFCNYTLLKNGNKYELLDTNLNQVFQKAMNYISYKFPNLIYYSSDGKKIETYFLKLPQKKEIKKEYTPVQVPNETKPDENQNFTSGDTDYMTNKNLKTDSIAEFKQYFIKKHKTLSDSLEEEFRENYKSKMQISYDFANGRNSNTFTIYDENYSVLKKIEHIDRYYKFNKYTYAKKVDSTFIYDENGEILFSTSYNSCDQKPGYIDLYDPVNKLFGIYCPFTDVYIKPKYKFIQAIDRDAFFIVINEKNEFGYLNSEGLEMF